MEGETPVAAGSWIPAAEDVENRCSFTISGERETSCQPEASMSIEGVSIRKVYVIGVSFLVNAV